MNISRDVAGLDGTMEGGEKLALTQYSKRGYLPALKFAFGHEMGTKWAHFGHGADFWPKNFDFSEGERGKSEVMRMPERQ